MTIVHAVELRTVGIPLIRPFRTSFGEETHKSCVLVRVITDDAEGWGECVASPDPGYSEEFNDGAWLVLGGFLLPALFAAGDVTTDDLDRVLAGVRGNPMAKATLIDAFLDAELRAAGRSLAEHLGAVTDRVACGVSVGITRDDRRSCSRRWTATSPRATGAIKLKIEPGLDVERVRAVRAAHPGILLSVDANAAYTLADVDVFLALDELDLLDGRTAVAPRRPGRTREAAGTDPDGHLPGRVDPFGGRRRRGDRARGLPDHQHQAGPRRGRPRGAADPRCRTGRERPRLVRRHARDRDRQGDQPGARRVAGVHAPGRHQRVRALLRRRHHGAVRGRGGRHDGRSRRAGDRRVAAPGTPGGDHGCASRRSRRDRRLVRRAA